MVGGGASYRSEYGGIGIASERKTEVVMKKKSKQLKNKDMNNEVYALRRRVMNFIYEARELAEMPRVEVRITDNHERILGQARMSGNIIWITERAVTYSDFDLRTIVFHELLHAVFGVEHDEGCKLMKAIHEPLTKSEVHKLFKGWVKKSTKSSLVA
jgi:hypothetical protein